MDWGTACIACGALPCMAAAWAAAHRSWWPREAAEAERGLGGLTGGLPPLPSLPCAARGAEGTFSAAAQAAMEPAKGAIITAGC